MNKTDYLERTIEIARANMAKGGGPFGAVIVKNDEIIAESGNRVTVNNDPTAHAEIEAIRQAASKLKDFDLSGCQIYASCEPCPMCLGAIYWARIDSLTFAASRTDAADAGFDDALIYQELERPPARRKINTTQQLSGKAVEVFEEWKKLEKKTRY